MVGVLNHLLVLLNGFCPLVVLVVFLGELTLREQRVWLLVGDCFQFLNSHSWSDVEICVGILHVSDRVFRVEVDGHFVVTGRVAIVFLVGKHVALEKVDVAFVFVFLLSVLQECLIFFFVDDRVCVVVSACDFYFHFGSFFLSEFVGLFEEVLRCVGVVFLERYRTFADVVEGVLSVVLDAEVKIF